MRRIRLIPVVIFAAGALLALKGIGLMTGHGYLLGGVGPVIASGGAPAAAGHGEETGAAADGAPSIELPGSPTLEDRTPTAIDAAPTLNTGGAEAGHGGDAGHGADAADHAIPAPVAADGNGTKLPLQGLDNTPADAALLERLGERRTALDQRENDLDMRAKLVEAAEKRINERMAELQALEARVTALVDQRDGAEAEQFKSVVSMYEAMKPRDAAAILNNLDIGVLLPIAQRINPRKMAPILAAMEPARAQELTIRLASGGEQKSADAAPVQRALPQIIGQ